MSPRARNSTGSWVNCGERVRSPEGPRISRRDPTRRPTFLRAGMPTSWRMRNRRTLRGTPSLVGPSRHMRQSSVSRPKSVTRLARERSSEGSRTARPRRSRFQLNLLRDCGASLKSAAAGIRCWGCFCDEAAKPHVPPTEEGVLARPIFSGDRRSFKIYVARLEKARLHLGVDAS